MVHSQLNIRNFVSGYPTMQIFSGATGDNAIVKPQ